MSHYLERQESTLKETFNQFQTLRLQDKSSTENNERTLSELKTLILNNRFKMRVAKWNFKKN